MHVSQCKYLIGLNFSGFDSETFLTGLNNGPKKTLKKITDAK